MVLTKLLLPKLGMTMTHGKVIKWLKTESDPVKKREEILEIDTDKVTLKIESPVDGFLRKIVVHFISIVYKLLTSILTMSD